ncbi:acyl-CoA carboxylase subunit epsilon [Streptomyces sp. NBC_00210]|uniref:acyl-CoA carboxylase epsilon subunit n=1 Tax=unclassified Streptomyces TaxID=2593676 RepID=UPI00324774A1
MTRSAAIDVQVLRGRPTAEELAAALVALRALAAQSAQQHEAPGELGGRRRRRMDGLRPQPGQRGPGAWRKSGWR